MNQYRKMPVVIEAEQWQAFKNVDGVCMCDNPHLKSDRPALASQAFSTLGDGYPHIHTLEGSMTVSPGDYVIRGVKGEYYPCKPDIFEATYEKVDA